MIRKSGTRFSPCVLRNDVLHKGEGTGPPQPAAAPQGQNPFVLVNYSSTICLNPPLLIDGRWRSRPIFRRREKRCDGGPAKSQGLDCQGPDCEGPGQGSGQGSGQAAGRDPAVGGRPDSRRAPAR